MRTTLGRSIWSKLNAPLRPIYNGNDPHEMNIGLANELTLNTAPGIKIYRAI